MSPAAILALISDLYEQISALRERERQLVAELEKLKGENAPPERTVV